jgi:hypothetical protein
VSWVGGKYNLASTTNCPILITYLFTKGQDTSCQCEAGSYHTIPLHGLHPTYKCQSITNLVRTLFATDFAGTNQLNLVAPPFYKEKASRHRMPSTRRIKVFGLLVFIGVITLLFYTSSARQQRNALSGDFYAKTKNALDNKQTQGKGEIAQAQGLRNAEDEELAKQMQERLKDAAKSAKDAANAKAPKPDPPSQLVGMGNAAEGAGGERSVAGRKKMGGGDKGTQEVVKEESKEDSDIKAELNSILKKSTSTFSSLNNRPAFES